MSCSTPDQSAKRLGGVAVACGLIVFALLMPIGGVGAAELHGAATARAAALALLTGTGMAVADRLGGRSDYRRVMPVTVCLLALAGIGTIVSAFNADSPREFVSMTASAAGQPILYAGVLVVFFRVLNADAINRQRLLAVWALAIIAEAIVVLWQLASGSAHDEFRGVTRAGGTLGSDFAGAVAVMSLFAIGALLLDEPLSRRNRLLGWSGAAASIFVLVAAVSRGPLAAAGAGLGYVTITSLRSCPGRRQSLVMAGVLCLSLAVGIALGQDLWQGRLQKLEERADVPGENALIQAQHSQIVRLSAALSRAGSAVEADQPESRWFDRSATWISGLRIGEDHLWTGVGSGRVYYTVQHNRRYRYTPYGYTHSNPHNTWIFAFAESGIFYATGLVLVTFTLLRAILAGRNPSAPARYLRGALIAVFPLFMINNDFTHPEIMILVLFCAAALVQPTEDTRIQAPAMEAK